MYIYVLYTLSPPFIISASTFSYRSTIYIIYYNILLYYSTYILQLILLLLLQLVVSVSADTITITDILS